MIEKENKYEFPDPPTSKGFKVLELAQLTLFCEIKCLMPKVYFFIRLQMDSFALKFKNLMYVVFSLEAHAV